MKTLEDLHIGSFIDGHEVKGGNRASLEIRRPYFGKVVGKIDCATLEDVDHAVATKKMPAQRRSEILRKTADLLETRVDQFARHLSFKFKYYFKAQTLEPLTHPAISLLSSR